MPLFASLAAASSTSDSCFSGESVGSYGPMARPPVPVTGETLATVTAAPSAVARAAARSRARVASGDPSYPTTILLVPPPWRGSNPIHRGTFCDRRVRNDAKPSTGSASRTDGVPSGDFKQVWPPPLGPQLPLRRRSSRARPR
jgi:hypothetical protein